MVRKTLTKPGQADVAMKTHLNMQLNHENIILPENNYIIKTILAHNFFYSLRKIGFLLGGVPIV